MVSNTEQTATHSLLKISKMSRRSAILLLKKLSQLESELVEAFRLPPHSATDQKLSRRLQKRFDCINNLLSTPEENDQHDEIRVKLAGLEAAFRCWTDYRTNALNMYHDDALASVCSDCMDNDGGGKEAVENVGGGEECGWSFGGLGKLCGAFGSGVVAGVLCCTPFIDFASSLFLQYQHLYFMPPT